MSKVTSDAPHGGELVNLLKDQEHVNTLKKIAMNFPDIILNNRQLCDLELLATGAISPLEGFMNRADYESILDRMRLQNNLLWPIPLCLDISETISRSIEAGQSVALRDSEGFLLAVMHVEHIWPVDRQKEAEMVYGTADPNHPGVNYLLNLGGDYYTGGRLG